MKIDRLIGILSVLLQSGKTTAPALAERFEVSRRTILRDIDTLNMAGIPVVTTRGSNGGIAIMDGYRVDHSVLTVDEMQNLVSALKGLDSVSARSSFETLMAKLAPADAAVSLAGNVVIDLSGGFYKDSLSEKIACIKQAIAERRTLTFDYIYPKGETRRELEPYCVEFRWQAWYVFGWCRRRGDFRRFKLNRLWNLEATDRHFSPRPVPPAAADATEAFGNPDQARLRFDKSVRYRLIEEYGPDCYEQEGDNLLLTVDYADRDYILQWVLSFGDKAEILSPADLRAQLGEIAQNMHQKYQI